MRIESTNKKKVFTLDGHTLNAVKVAYYGPHAGGYTHIWKHGWELQYKGVTLIGRKCENSSYGFHAEFETLNALLEDIQYCNSEDTTKAYSYINIFLKRIEKINLGDRRK